MTALDFVIRQERLWPVDHECDYIGSQISANGKEPLTNGSGSTACETDRGIVNTTCTDDAIVDPTNCALLLHLIDTELTQLGFTRNCNGYYLEGALTKPRIRSLHSRQRSDVLARNREFIRSYGTKLVEHFADGSQVDPELVDPELVEIASESPESRLFRFASLLWSVPVSQGFGRRLRFLVRDRQNGRLIGLFAIGDPVFNLSTRDNWIGWTHKDRSQRLIHVMDAYVVGAVPPYSQLIGGKLVAALMGSQEVIDAYDRKYLGRQSVISKTENRARLALLTTTSALGRSSIYNRLAIPDGPQFHRIGVTKGYGHFHLSGVVFESLRRFLEASGHPYASGYRFGMGPNWRFRVARAALEQLGLNGNGVLRHGIEREVFAVPLAKNWQQILLGAQSDVEYSALSVSEIAEYCRRRWMVPRSTRDESYRRFTKHAILDSLQSDNPELAR